MVVRYITTIDPNPKHWFPIVYPQAIMSSHSSDVSDHQDELFSCGTYSSGWDRSSTSEYWDSSSDYEEEEEYHHEKPVVAQPKKKPTTTEFEYKCELVVLPNPYLKFNTTQKISPPLEEEKEETTEDEKEEEKVPVANPWKVDNSPPQQAEDPWKFLEEMNKPPEKEQSIPHREQKRDHKTTTSRHIDNSNTNNLCKYKDKCRMNKNNQCNMVHTLSAWKPRICRFNQNCKRKCGYYHTKTPLTDYLRTMIHTPDTIYAKNAALYEKYL